MNIKILHSIEGAKQATGITVIIDVFRAFSVEAYLIASGAEKIIPVADVEFAYEYKEMHPDIVLVGERHGRIIEGFDYGNSPAQLEDANLKNKTIIHTTSNGTQGIANAKNAKEILTGSLVNAKAIATYIKMSECEEVSLVCMGRGLIQTEDDYLCAEYIKSLLEGKEINLDDRIKDLKNTEGSKFFNKDEQDVFPERDFYLSTDVDKFNFVLKVEKDDETGLNYIKKIDVL